MGIWRYFVKKIFIWSLTRVYDYIDQDDDDKISKEEFNLFYTKMKDLLNLVKKRK